MSALADKWESQEKRNKQRGRITSGIVHAILLLLLFFITYTFKFPPEQEGILLNFGTVDAGSSKVQPKVMEEAVKETQPEEAAPEETSQEVVEEEVLTQDMEEAPVINNVEEETVTEEETEVEEETTETVEETTQPAEEEIVKEEPKVDPNALFTGAQSNEANQSSNQGDNIYKGDQGNPDGDPDASNLHGQLSTGLGDDGVGWSLAGRKILVKPKLEDQSQHHGKVYVTIKVDKSGKVIHAQFRLKGSTTQAAHLVNKAIAAAKKAKFNADANAREEQIGVMVFNFKLN